MDLLKKLQAKREDLAGQIREVADRQDKWSAEDREKYAKLNTAYDENLTALTAELKRVEDDLAEQTSVAQRLELLNGHVDRTPPFGRDNGAVDRGAAQLSADSAIALQAWFLFQSGEAITDQHAEACRRVSLNPQQPILDAYVSPTGCVRLVQDAFVQARPADKPSRARAVMAAPQFRNDLSVVTGSSGAFTVPTGFINSLEINLLTFGGMREVSEIIRTDKGDDKPWPTADDTSNQGEYLGEAKTIGSSVDPTFGAVVWGAHKCSSKLIKVPVELLEDSAFNMPMILGEMVGERIGRRSNLAFTTGTGVKEPRGIVIDATLGVTAASATVIAADELFNLVHSVDPAYRVGAGWMFHDNILLVIRKLKDSQNQYLWQEGLSAGVPDRLLAHPFTINQDMASAVATGNKTILFGSLKKYKIREVRTIRFRRLVERFADEDQEGFVAFMRNDGKLLDAGTAPVKFLQQA